MVFGVLRFSFPAKHNLFEFIVIRVSGGNYFWINQKDYFCEGLDHSECRDFIFLGQRQNKPSRRNITKLGQDSSEKIKIRISCLLEDIDSRRSLRSNRYAVRVVLLLSLLFWSASVFVILRFLFHFRLS